MAATSSSVRSSRSSSEPGPSTQWRVWPSSSPSATFSSARLDRADLRDHVDAVAVVLDHPLDAADLALDALEPGDELLLGGAVPARGSGLRHAVMVYPHRVDGGDQVQRPRDQLLALRGRDHDRAGEGSPESPPWTSTSTRRPCGSAVRRSTTPQSGLRSPTPATRRPPSRPWPPRRRPPGASSGTRRPRARRPAGRAGRSRARRCPP